MSHVAAVKSILPDGWSVIERDYDYCAGIISPSGERHLFNIESSFVPFCTTEGLIRKIINDV